MLEDLTGLERPGRAPYQILVDLDDVERQTHQIVDIGIARAVIIERESDAFGAHLVHGLENSLISSVGSGLGDLGIDP